MTIENEAQERAWIEGRRSFARSLLRLAASELNSGNERTLAYLQEELDATREKLRDVCAIVGDNDWKDGLYLPDVVEKHILRHLESEVVNYDDTTTTGQ